MSDAQNPLQLPWRADGVFVLNCDGYPIADADTKRDVAFITLAVNNHDALVALAKYYGQQLCEHSPSHEACGKLTDEDCGGCPARALLAKIGEQQ